MRRKVVPPATHLMRQSRQSRRARPKTRAQLPSQSHEQLHNADNAGIQESLAPASPAPASPATLAPATKPQDDSRGSSNNSNSSGTSSPSKTTASYTYVLASTYGIGDGLMYSATASGGRVLDLHGRRDEDHALRYGHRDHLIMAVDARAVVNDRGPCGQSRLTCSPPWRMPSVDGVGRVGHRVVG